MIHFNPPPFCHVPRRMALSFYMTLVYLIHLLDMVLRYVLSLYKRVEGMFGLPCRPKEVIPICQEKLGERFLGAKIIFCFIRIRVGPSCGNHRE